MPRGHAVLARLAEASRDIWTAAGFIEEGAAAQIYNSQAVLRDGSVAFVHRNLNLATYGRLEAGKHFAAGRFLQQDRKTVVLGQGVSVRIDLGGRRLM